MNPMSEDLAALAGKEERWLSMPDFHGLYEISSLGRVRSLARWVGTLTRRWRVPMRILSLGRTRKGYPSISLSREGKAYPREVHRLVCRAFHGEPPAGMEAAHINGVKVDCGETNLAWKTRKANHADKRLHGTLPLGEALMSAKLTSSSVTDIWNRMNAGGSFSDLATEYGVHQPAVRQIMAGTTWKHHTSTLKQHLQETPHD